MREQDLDFKQLSYHTNFQKSIQSSGMWVRGKGSPVHAYCGSFLNRQLDVVLIWPPRQFPTEKHKPWLVNSNISVTVCFFLIH